MAAQVSLLVALMALLGCATPQQRAEAHAWRVICAEAPHALGQRLEAREQKAMAVVDPQWRLSVEAVDTRCRGER